MFKRQLYFRILGLIIGALFVFSVLAVIVWGAIGYDRYGDELYDRSARLAEPLLPPAEASQIKHKDAVDVVATLMEYEVTVYDGSGSLLAASHTPAPLGVSPAAIGTWTANFGRTQYATRLSDGRTVIVVLDRPPMPDNTIAFALFLAILTAFVTALIYPVARNVTRRLERLRARVEQIGDGALSARVDIEGEDEIAALAQSFNIAAEQIEALVDSQRLLLANASHELRTPLARIRLGIEFLEKKDDPARRKALKSDVAELDALIHELLLLSRLEAPTARWGHEQFDLVGLIAEECARYDNCYLDVSALPMVKGNSRLIQHMLRNLVDNAFQHGAAPVNVSVVEDEGFAVISVSDAGSGISEKDRPHILEPFYRGAGRQNVPGYGLGLALVKRIAEAHGGTVEIKSYPKSLFRVRLSLTHGSVSE